jgi:chromosome segregation ATPase
MSTDEEKLNTMKKIEQEKEMLSNELKEAWDNISQVWEKQTELENKSKGFLMQVEESKKKLEKFKDELNKSNLKLSIHVKESEA